VTTGSLSNPRVDDDNDGRQVAGRAVVRPNAAVAIGASAARGAFISRSVQTALAAGRDVRDGVQEALGVDAEYSAGHFLARSEVIWSQWTLPIALASDRNTALTATAYLAEARYRLLPGMHVAGRIERLGFSRLRTAAAMLPWDAPVRRFELGVGYSVIRNIMVKASWQRNFRDGGRVRDEGLGALQVVYWF
jgi:predicted porin